MIRLGAAPLCLLLALPAAGQTAEEVIAKNIEARGGLARIKAIETVRYTARSPIGPQPASVFDETGASRNITTMILELKRPNLSRSTMLVPGFSQLQYEQAIQNNMTADTLQSFAAKQGQKQLAAQAQRGDYSWAGASSVSGFDGKTFWMWSSQQQQVTTRLASELSTGFGFDGPLVDYQAKGFQVELQGKAKKEGKECFKLRLTSKGGEVSTYYIDAKTFLEVAYEGKPKDAPMGVRIVYMDWKPVDGIMVAHTTVQTTLGIGNRRMTIDKVEFNVPIDDARFAAPRAK